MATEKEATKITFGGWYQRTTLHLSEIYNLLSKGKSDLELNGAKLKNLHEKLNFSLKSLKTFLKPSLFRLDAYKFVENFNFLFEGILSIWHPFLQTFFSALQNQLILGTRRKILEIF